MNEGKDYCERKINLLKSNFDQLIEVCFQSIFVLRMLRNCLHLEIVAQDTSFGFLKPVLLMLIVFGECSSLLKGTAF